MEKEIKNPTTYDEQIAKLKRRGCYIPDEVFCRETLKSINYYRLMAYFLPFKDGDGYVSGTSFQRVYRIYEFDRKLRAILFSAIEEVEINLRARFAYFHAHRYGATGYLNPENFSKKHDREKFMRNMNREIENNRQVLFVKHHMEHYDGVFPIWVMSELFTFGMLSYFFGDLKTADRKQLAKELYDTVPQNVVSWLRCCTDLRNICAHYGRLYYRIFPAVPAGVDVPKRAEHRLWGAIMALRELYPNAQKWNDEVLTSLEALFEEYGKDIDLYHLAFPRNWSTKLKK